MRKYAHARLISKRKKMKPTALHSGKLFPSLCLLIVLFFAGEGYPQETFAKKIIGGGSPIAVVQSADGGYVSVSTDVRSTYVGSTFLVRKTTGSGTRAWERQVSFTTTDRIHIAAIAQTTDGGYVIVGSDKFLIDFFFSEGIVVKLSPGGNILWARSFRKGMGPNPSVEFTSVSDTPDTGFIVTGRDCLAADDIFDCSIFGTILVTFNSAGAVLSAKSFGKLAPKSGFGLRNLLINLQIVSAADSGFFAAVDNGNGASVIKVDDLGNILWRELLEIDHFLFSTLAATSNGGVIFAGRCGGAGCVIKLKGNGQIEWKKRFAFDVRIQSISDVTQTSDGGYLVTGTTRNGFLFKVDSSGKAVFGRQFANAISDFIFSTADGGFFLFGTRISDMLLWKLKSDGTNDCTLSDSPKFKSIPFGNVNIEVPQFDSTNLFFQGSTHLDVNSAPSKKQVSTACP